MIVVEVVRVDVTPGVVVTLVLLVVDSVTVLLAVAVLEGLLVVNVLLEELSGQPVLLDEQHHLLLSADQSCTEPAEQLWGRAMVVVTGVVDSPVVLS